MRTPAWNELWINFTEWAATAHYGGFVPQPVRFHAHLGVAEALLSPCEALRLVLVREHDIKARMLLELTCGQHV